MNRISRGDWRKLWSRLIPSFAIVLCLHSQDKLNSGLPGQILYTVVMFSMAIGLGRLESLQGTMRRVVSGALVAGLAFVLVFRAQDGSVGGVMSLIFYPLLLVLLSMGFWALEGLQGNMRRIVLLALCGLLALIFNGFVLFALYSLFNPGPAANVSILLVILFMIAMTAPLAWFLDVELAAIWRTGHSRLWRRWFRH